MYWPICPYLFGLSASLWADIQNMEKEAQAELEVQESSLQDARKNHSSKSKSPETSKESSPREKDACSFRQIRRKESRDSAGKDCDADGPGPTPGTPSKRQKSRSPPGRLSSTVHFISGNPCVESVKGILHLYKDRWVFLWREELQLKLTTSIRKQNQNTQMIKTNAYFD